MNGIKWDLFKLLKDNFHDYVILEQIHKATDEDFNKEIARIVQENFNRDYIEELTILDLHGIYFTDSILNEIVSMLNEKQFLKIFNKVFESLL